MKNKIILFAMLYIVTSFVTPLQVSAQTDQTKEYKEMLIKYLKSSGATATTDSIMPQLIPMLKRISPTIDEVAINEFTTKWTRKIENKIIEMYTPIYQKYITLDELKQVVDFQNSPIGQKLSKVGPACMKEVLPMMQQLTMEMMQDIPREELKTCVNVEKPMSKSGKTDQQMFAEAYTAPHDSITLSPLEYRRGMSTKPTLYAIERRKKDTKVTFSAPVYFDSQWFHFGLGFKIIDKQSGDEYNVRGYDGGTPFGRLMIVKGFNNKCIFISLIFPKLKKSVKQIDIVELPHEKDVLPSNDDGLSREYLNVTIENYSVSKKNNKNKKIYN